MKTGDFFAPIFLPGVLFLRSLGTGRGIRPSTLLTSADGRWTEGSWKAKRLLKEGCLSIFHQMERKLFQKPTKERKMTPSIPSPFAIVPPPSWPSFAHVPIESTRWSEGENKVKAQPNQGGWNVEIKANKSKTKQNKVNQGILTIFHLKRVNFTRSRAAGPMHED